MQQAYLYLMSEWELKNTSVGPSMRLQFRTVPVYITLILLPLKLKVGLAC